MNIAVLIIHRGDRPRFLENLMRMINAQTLQPTEVYELGSPPENDVCDISKRYRLGYLHLSKVSKADVIAFMEVDDYYAPNYLEEMAKAWQEAGKPDLFGTTNTIYYNIKLFAYFKMQHYLSGIAMATLIKPNLDLGNVIDEDPYFDKHIYNHITNKELFTPNKTICIGIKHGDGMTGGSYHHERLDRFTTNKGITDYDKSFLKANMDKDSFEFYSNYFKQKSQPI